MSDDLDSRSASDDPLQAETILYGERQPKPSALVAPRPMMTASGPSAPVAHYVCPDCGEVRKLPSDGKADERPWCSHSNTHMWSRPEHAEKGWTQMEYAEVRIGKPHANDDSWSDPFMQYD